MRFQSTRLRKPRHHIEYDPVNPKNFNPRGCVSVDNQMLLRTLWLHEFQSTRLRKPRQQKHSKKHNHLTPKYNSYTNTSSHIL